MRTRLLVVARDVALRARLARVLNGGGYRVEIAESAAHARRIDLKGITLAIVAIDELGPEGTSLPVELGDTKTLRVVQPGSRHAPGADVVDASDEPAVLARVAEALRPVSAIDAEAPVLLFAGYRLDLGGHSLFNASGVEVQLTRGELSLLREFVQRPGRMLSRDHLLRALAGRDAEAFDRSIDMLIVRLRRKIEPDPKHPSLIVTVPGSGYKFAAKVQKAAAIVSPEPEPSKAPPGPVAAVPPSDTARRHIENPLSPCYGAISHSRQWVGRAAPLETLERLTRQMLAGQRQTVFVTGEAGIGKTTFVEMAVERLSRHGVGVLWGRCTELFGTNEAFFPLIDALQERCRVADGASLLKRLRDHAPTWLAQMPEFLDANDSTEFKREIFGTTRERMLREFCNLMEIIALDCPWIIVLEDLHWSDHATLDVLSRLARGGRVASFLVLATYRPGDVVLGANPVERMHQDLQIHKYCVELALDRLSRAEFEQYLLLRFGSSAMNRKLGELIFGRTHGQPLFTVSLIDYLVAQKSILQVDAHWRLAADDVTVKTSMPHDLRGMITRHIDRLTADEQRLLEAGSAAGAEFAATLVAASTDGTVLDVEKIFQALARNGHILATAGVSEWPDGTVSGRYAFQHTLYQEVLYQRLAPGHRVQTHRRLGEWLEQEYKGQTIDIASVLAKHFEAGRDFAKAIRYLMQAAESAAKRFGYREAESYLTLALGLVDRLAHDDQLMLRITLRQQRGSVRRAAGDLAGAVEDFNAMIVHAADAKNLFLEVSGLVDLSRVLLFVDRRECLYVADQAAAKTRFLNDDVIKTLVQGVCASTRLYLKGWREDDAELCRRTLKIADKAQDPLTLLRVYRIETILNGMTSEYRHCHDAATNAKSSAQDIGDIFLYAVLNAIGSFALVHLGEWRELKQEMESALVMAERNANLLASVICRLTFAWFHAEAFDFEGARCHCEGAPVSLFEENPYIFFFHRVALAKAYLGLRDYPAALKQFEDLCHKIEAEGNNIDCVYYPAFCNDFCEYWLGVGDLVQARKYAAQLYEYTAPAPDRNYLALAHGLLARIAVGEGDLGEAEAHITRAVSTLEKTQLPLAAWRVYLTAASYWEKMGDQRRAADYRSRSETVIQILSDTLDQDDALRSSLLTGFAAEVRRHEVQAMPNFYSKLMNGLNPDR